MAGLGGKLGLEEKITVGADAIRLAAWRHGARKKLFLGCPVMRVFQFQAIGSTVGDFPRPFRTDILSSLLGS
jgi:hypothetical protein